jgi:hypothetical protein
VLVELPDQRVHLRRDEVRAVEAVERGEDPDVGRIAAKRAAPDVGELLDVVGADVARARLERHDVAQLRRRHLLGHAAHERPVAVGDRREHAVDDRHRGSDERRTGLGDERPEQRAHACPDQQSECRLERAQAEHPSSAPLTIAMKSVPSYRTPSSRPKSAISSALAKIRCQSGFGSAGVRRTVVTASAGA